MPWLLPTRLSTREIGRELYVSPNTVRSRAQAVTNARQLGLLLIIAVHEGRVRSDEAAAIS